MLVFRQARFSIAAIADLDARLQDADNLDAIRQACDELISDNVSKSTRQSPVQVPVRHGSDLRSLVTAYIETNKPASLQSLLASQIEEICNTLLSDQFSLNTEPNFEKAVQRVRDYDDVLLPVLPAFATLGYWGDEVHQRLVGSAIERVANFYESAEMPRDRLYKVWISWRKYPPTLLAYVVGFAAWLNGRFSTLHILQSNLHLIEQGRREPLMIELNHWRTESKEDWNNLISPKQQRLTPVSEHLLSVCSQAMSGLVMQTPTELQHQFDRFEYFLGLVHHYGDCSALSDAESGWGPIGRFLWTRFGRRASGETMTEEFLREAAAERKWPGVDAGFFDGDPKRVEPAIRGYDRFLQRVITGIPGFF